MDSEELYLQNPGLRNRYRQLPNAGIAAYSSQGLQMQESLHTAPQDSKCRNPCIQYPSPPKAGIPTHSSRGLHMHESVQNRYIQLPKAGIPTCSSPGIQMQVGMPKASRIRNRYTQRLNAGIPSSSSRGLQNRNHYIASECRNHVFVSPGSTFSSAFCTHGRSS